MALNQTLGEMRSELQTRLGFGMSGSAGIVNSPIIDSFIRTAQDELYQEFNWAELHKVVEFQVGTEQDYFDYPVDCDLERIKTLSVLDNGDYLPMSEGISLGNRNAASNQAQRPYRFHKGAQVEIFPKPDKPYTIRLEYTKALAPLVNDNDRTSIPSRIVFLKALIGAKMHYRQPDGPAYAQQLENLLSRLRAGQRTMTEWSAGSGGQFDSHDYPPGGTFICR